ncbi:MAG: hypothetical protein JSW15_03560 [Deltaproteobacteria bacterium]|nr:MAG: hypothetical protein JSW15_03560 [Deltaproteobacteria bacterium]
MEGKYVSVTADHGVFCITIDRPPLNALNKYLLGELITTFEDLTDQEQLRSVVLTGKGESVKAMKVDKVSVLGVGTIGYQIAQVAAQSGYSVVLRDIEEKLLEEATNKIKKTCRSILWIRARSARMKQITLLPVSKLLPTSRPLPTRSILLSRRSRKSFL